MMAQPSNDNPYDEEKEASISNLTKKKFNSVRDAPPNDITVNSNGKVTNVVINNKPHRIFDENGNQLYMNDSPNDSQCLDLIREDDQLYNIIDVKTYVDMILKAGVSSPFLEGLVGQLLNHMAWQILEQTKSLQNTEYHIKKQNMMEIVLEMEIFSGLQVKN